MLASWRRSSLRDTMAQRLAHTYADAAVSITITSLTDMLSFYVGTITPFVSVKIFCVYTGTAVLMTYLGQITLFGGCLALAGRLEAQQKHNITGVVVKPVSESKNESKFYRMCCAGGISRKDPCNPEDNKPHAIMFFFRDYFATFLNMPVVKGVILVSFVVYLMGAIYGCTTIQEGLERRKLVRYDSYAYKFYDFEDLYFSPFPYKIMVVIEGDMLYHKPETEKKILDFIKTIENHRFIAEEFTESWQKNWPEFMKRNGAYQGLVNSDEKSYIKNLKENYLGGEANIYALDVKFNEDETRIIASRFVVQAYNAGDSISSRILMDDLRMYCEQSGLNASAFHPIYMFFDQFALVRITSIQAILIAACVMLLVSLVFIPNPFCSLWVAFSIISIEIGVVGYMSLWAVNLDSISMIQLIMCIGFSVDFSAHISYAYLSANAENPAERVKECLFNLGLPIVQGALSTIFGVLILLLSPSYVFITFAKTAFLVMFFGAAHGLFLLPVLLSLLGPGSCSKRKRNSHTFTAQTISENEVVIPKAVDYYSSAPSQKDLHHYKAEEDMGSYHNVVVNQPRSESCKIISTENIDIKPMRQNDIRNMNGGLGLRMNSDRVCLDNTKRNIKPITRQNGEDRAKDRSHYERTNGHGNDAYVYDEFQDAEIRARERRNQYYGQWESLQPRRHESATDQNDAIDQFRRHSSDPSRASASSCDYKY